MLPLSAEGNGAASPLQYPWVLSAFDSRTEAEVYTLTLEQTPGGPPMLCGFDNADRHVNFGPTDLREEAAFLNTGLAALKDLLKLDDIEPVTNPRGDRRTLMLILAGLVVAGLVIGFLLSR